MMSRTTGLAIDEDAHIRQSIEDILTTPVGTRVKRRDYGSLLPELIDHPGNPGNLLRLRAATVMAVLRWEPRVRISTVGLAVQAGGRTTLDIDAVKTSGPRSGSSISITVPLR